MNLWQGLVRLGRVVERAHGGLNRDTTQHEPIDTHLSRRYARYDRSVSLEPFTDNFHCNGNNRSATNSAARVRRMARLGHYRVAPWHLFRCCACCCCCIPFLCPFVQCHCHYHWVGKHLSDTSNGAINARHFFSIVNTRVPSRGTEFPCLERSLPSPKVSFVLQHTNTAHGHGSCPQHDNVIIIVTG